jgi:hypothetical protein
MALVNVEIGGFSLARKQQGKGRNSYYCSHKIKGSAHRNLLTVKFNPSLFDPGGLSTIVLGSTKTEPKLKPKPLSLLTNQEQNSRGPPPNGPGAP